MHQSDAGRTHAFGIQYSIRFEYLCICYKNMALDEMFLQEERLWVPEIGRDAHFPPIIISLFLVDTRHVFGVFGSLIACQMRHPLREHFFGW
jgi:hypothetical protein